MLELFPLTAAIIHHSPLFSTIFNDCFDINFREDIMHVYRIILQITKKKILDFKGCKQHETKKIDNIYELRC